MQDKTTVHLFLCPGGVLLPRWAEAFPAARCGDPRSRALDPAPVDLVWLRLRQGEPVAAQLAALPAAVRGVPLVVLSDLPADEEALAALAAGARGYLNSHAQARLLQRVAAVMQQGGLWIGESLMQRLLRASARIAQAGPVPVPQPLPAPTPPPTVAAPPQGDPASAGLDWARGLTGREQQVALRVASGESNKEVARALGITERTVKAHVGAVLEKLQLRDRLQLALRVNGRQSS